MTAEGVRADAPHETAIFAPTYLHEVAFVVSTGTPFTSCNLDMDGDTLLSSTKEWLVLLRASLGFTGTGTATTAGTGISAAQWTAARPLINANCGTNFGP